MKNKEVRKDMALDDKKGCSTCGIWFLSKSVYQRGERHLCGACMCAEEMVAQTPSGSAGQCDCQLCGILIEPTKHKQKTADYCSASRLPPNTAGQQGDFSKTCQCKICSNPYDISSAAQNFVKMSIEPTPGNFTTEGSNSIKEKGPCEVLLREEMKRKQLSLKEKLVSQDSSTVKKMLQAITTKDGSGGKTFYIGGVDISFIKDNNDDGCAALIIMSFPDLEVVYKQVEMIHLTEPYIPGFLAFREVDSLLRLYEALLNDAPQYKPDVIFVDGNGRLHPRGFGLACHLGVLLDLPCVGVAKTLIHVDGIEDSAEHKAKIQTLKSSGDTFPLITNHGHTLGMALRSTCSSSNPVYVSVGHKISLQSAVTLVHHCCKYRIPEPTRFADLYSRQYLNEKCKPEAVVQEGEVWPN